MDESSLETAEAVVRALGGPTKVARLTGRSPQQVWNWKKKEGRFPGAFFLLMTHELAAIGKRAPASLWGQVERASDVPSRVDTPF